MNIVYFDNAATTKIRSEVLNEMIPYLTSNYGNASSLYSIGRTSKHAIDNARAQVASLINCNPNEIYFTSCGSESDNTALKGIAFANKKKGNHIITSKIEHPEICLLIMKLAQFSQLKILQKLLIITILFFIQMQFRLLEIVLLMFKK